MSRKRKNNLEIAPAETVEVKSEDISYRVFFNECLARGLVKSWQEREIHAFFKDLGLTDKEPKDKYKDAWVKF